VLGELLHSFRSVEEEMARAFCVREAVAAERWRDPKRFVVGNGGRRGGASAEAEPAFYSSRTVISCKGAGSVLEPSSVQEWVEQLRELLPEPLRSASLGLEPSVRSWLRVSINGTQLFALVAGPDLTVELRLPGLQESIFVSNRRSGSRSQCLLGNGRWQALR
jgi:hypothetical protein